MNTEKITAEDAPEPGRRARRLTVVADAVVTAPKGSAMAAFVASLASLGVEYAGAEGKGGKWYCPNPMHPDEHASYDVFVGDGNKAGMPVGTCTPCREAMGQDEFYALLTEIGVVFDGKPCNSDDVDWGPRADASGGGSGKGKVANWKPVVTYRYNWFDGSPNFTVTRLEDADWVNDGEHGEKPQKTFRPKRWDDKIGEFKGGRGALDAVVRTPYKFDRFDEWSGERIYIVEGEKAADAIIDKGFRATTFHGGAAGTRMPEWADEFRRFSEVRVWTDLDEAGLKWAREIAAELKAAGVRVAVWCNNENAWTAKADAHEQLAVGGNPRAVTAALATAIRALHPLPSRPAKAVSATPAAIAGPGVLGFNPSSEPITAAKRFLDDKALRTADEMLLRNVGGKFYLWRGDRYEGIESVVLGQIVADHFDGMVRAVTRGEPARVNVKKATRTEIVTALEGLTHSTPGGSGGTSLLTMLTSEGGVPFRNGWLDVGTGEFSPHRTDRFVTWCVPGDYAPGEWKPEATPLWVEFLNSAGFASDSDNYRVLRQWFGYVLSGRTNVDRAMVLWGPRRAGKGTVLHVLSRLVGDAACATNMRAMTSTFGLSQMLGKTLATVDDCKWETYDRDAIEKMLTLTAFGEVPINRKFKDEITARLGVRLMLASNDFPSFKQESNALAGRLLILPFSISHYGNERLNLKKELEAELAGIAQWALGGLADLDANGGRFTVTAEQIAMEGRIELEGSQAKQFIADACKFAPLGKGCARIPIHGDAGLYAAYRRWAIDAGYKAFQMLPSLTLTNNIEAAFGEQVMKKPDRSNRNTMSMYGLRLRSDFGTRPMLSF